MKISHIESSKASASAGAAQAKILPKDRPRRSASPKPDASRQASPLEKGMAVAEAALAEVPDIRQDLVNELKQRIESGEYQVSGEEVAEMMLRRLAADKVR